MKVMDVRITMSAMKFYPNRYWFFYFRRYKHVTGFHGRIFGISFNIREGDATNKLTQKFIASRRVA
jgi:hypothetical protein